ncbi:MAG: hypothetical protein K0M48_13920 [Thiobacillus sp.]|nr:hypothetical protein [Thiobacillus sp.]
MPHDSDRDSLTEWFHELANLSQDEIRDQATPANLDTLRLHIQRSVPECSLPPDLTREQFAEVVYEFRKNEKSWNQATMASLIRADDLFKEGLVHEAVQELHRFAASCPWSLFKEVALNQATYYQ